MKFKHNKLTINYNTYEDQRGYFCKIYNSLPGKYMARFYPKHYKGKLFKEINILENKINSYYHYET